MTTLLLVDDDEMVRYALKKYLSRAGFDVTEADNGASAQRLIKANSFDLVITDIIMPEVEGLEFIHTLQMHHPDLPIIAISGGGRICKAEHLTMAEALGVKATLSKPFDPEDLVSAIRTLLPEA